MSYESRLREVPIPLIDLRESAKRQLVLEALGPDPAPRHSGNSMLLILLGCWACFMILFIVIAMNQTSHAAHVRTAIQTYERRIVQDQQMVLHDIRADILRGR